MRFGVHPVSFNQGSDHGSIPATLAETARTAEDLGFDWFVLSDHWFQMEMVGAVDDPMPEGYTSLGFVAAATRTIQLGLLVTGVTYRHPGLLAKTVATLDALSGGRALLGIGAGWYEREHRGLGVPFPPLGERFDRLEEALRICRQMWSANTGSFDGTHFQLAETICAPGPVRDDGIPIVVGGGGERRTLRLVAEHGDACNLIASGVDEVRHKLAVLDRHCADVGRDPSTVLRTVMVPFDVFDRATPFAEELSAYQDLGIGLTIFVPYGDPVGYLHRCNDTFLSDWLGTR
ncbi:MAG: LLM class F420-dependent oxidoreductase [Actinomycetota bacterium]